MSGDIHIELVGTWGAFQILFEQEIEAAKREQAEKDRQKMESILAEEASLFSLVYRNS